jgi:hypothetical protein
MSRLYSIAAAAAIVFGIATFMMVLVAELVLENMHLSLDSQALQIVATVGKAAGGLFFACALVLWFEAWHVLFAGWDRRSFGANTLLLAFVLLGHFIAAFGVHFYIARKKKHEKSLQMSEQQ